MLLFNNAEYDSFFNPLCCKNKRIYYECILQLIEKSKSVPLLYETDAKDTIILYLRNCAYAVEDEVASSNADENISSKKTETENAGAILRYFRRCGWISEREIGRNGDNIATVMPYCRKMIEAIERIFNRDNRAALTNHIFSIYDTLNTAFVADHGRTHRPYSTILIPVSDNVADLKNELLILKDSIRSIMRMIIKMTETNELGQFLIRDEMLENFFSDYFFIKKDGLIPGYIEEIEKMLRKIVKTEVYENMIKEYQSFYNADEISAREVVDGQLAEIKSFISYDYIKEMDYIDKKINNYYSLYSTRILMVLSNNVNMQTYLNDLLMTIKDFESDEKREIIESIAKCFSLRSYKYVGRKSIERREKRKPNTKTGAIITGSLSDEEKARLTRELLYEYPDRYGVKQATSYFESVLADKESIVPDKTIIKTRDDAMMIAGRRYTILVEPEYYDIADDVLNASKYKYAHLFNTKLLMRKDIKPVEDSVVQFIDAKNQVAKKYFDYQLGRFHATTVDKVRNYENAMSKEGRVSVAMDSYFIRFDRIKFYCLGQETIELNRIRAVKKLEGLKEAYIELQKQLTAELKNIKSVKLMVPYFMTIENRAAYLRYAKDDVVVFYLGGYANRYQRDFIKTVYMSNRNASYLHFGDIDAGGFWIHHNLCEITGVNFELFSMSADELGNKEFASCLHELSGNDRVRLRELKKIDVYEDVVRYMLHNNVKLEQEIVSLTLMRNETNS